MAEDRKEGVLEVKFLLPPERIDGVLGWMRRHLQPDPHGGGVAGDAYRVESVYLDNPRFDVYHRRGSFGRAKFRIRRYGDSPAVFLERKLKRAGIVRKRRVAIAPAAVGQLAVPVNGHVWEGSWFHRRTVLRLLRPVVMMNYSRIARLGLADDGRFRVTLDRELRAVPAEIVRIPEPIEGPDLLEGKAVLEVKFPETLPAVVRRLVEEQGLETAGVSKYRLGVRACGLVVEAPANADPTESDPAPGTAAVPA